MTKVGEMRTKDIGQTMQKADIWKGNKTFKEPSQRGFSFKAGRGS